VISRELWHKEAIGLEKELQRAWHLYDQTGENGPDFDNGPRAQRLLLDIIRLTYRSGFKGEEGKIEKAMHLLLEGILSDALVEIQPDTYVEVTTEPLTHRPCVVVRVVVWSDFPGVMPGPNRFFRSVFYIRAQPHMYQYDPDHLYYFVDYANDQEEKADPFPEDTVTLDEVERGVVEYIKGLA